MTSAASTAENVTFTDQALWQALGEQTSLAAFAEAWLTLQCRMVGGVTAARLTLGSGSGPQTQALATWPSADAIDEPPLAEVATLAREQARGVIRKVPATGVAPGADKRDRVFAGFPILIDGEAPGALALELQPRTESALRQAMRDIQWGAGWLELAWRRLEIAEARQQGERTAAAFAFMVSALEPVGYKAACQALATDMAHRLDANRVTVARMQGRRPRAVALSHSGGFGRKMALIRTIEAVLEEAVDQRTSIRYPLAEGDAVLITRAHEELARLHGAGAILTVPLSVGNEIVGGLVVEMARTGVVDDATVDIIDGAAAVLGPILEEKRRNDRSVFTKLAVALKNQGALLVGPGRLLAKAAVILVVAATAFFAVYTETYRISAEARLEGEVRRFIVAPFDSYIVAQHARAGQVVSAGQTLVTLDDTELLLERERYLAERGQRQVRRDTALAENNRAEVGIISAEIAETDARIALVEESLSRAEITAPFDGLVVAGDLSQSEGAPVQRGDLLFEIAPLDSYRVLLWVRDGDVGDVHPGQRGKVLLSALADQSFPVRVETVTAVTEVHDGENAFRVEARLQARDDRLRPGMEGVGKLEVGERRLIWIWTHRLWDWLRLQAWAWLP